jgi:ribosomal protein S18 acetylase RimI-like enzyme
MSWRSTVAFLYAIEPELTPREFIDLFRRSTLAERRPVNEPTTIAGMLEHADIILTARAESGFLVGVSRAITDFHYCTYLSDLAVDVDYQRQGIGRELIRRTHDSAGRRTRMILLSAPAAQGYYPHIGMRRHDSCWTIDPQRDAPSTDSSPVDHPLRPT